MCRSARLRNSTVIVVPDVSLKWKLMKQLLMLRLASPSLRADGMKDSCRYWDARVVIEKLWSMSELKKARPKGANLITDGLKYFTGTTKHISLCLLRLT